MKTSICKSDSMVFKYAATELKEKRQKAVERGLVLVFSLLCLMAISNISYLI